ADRHTILDGGAGLDFLGVCLLVAAAALEEGVEWSDDADADGDGVLRDVPEPALLVGGLDDHGGPFVAAGVAISAAPVGPDRPLVQDRVPEAQLELVLQHRALAAGVHDHLGAHLFLRAVLALNAHADRAAAVKQ